MSSVHVVVVGAGVFGTWTAWCLRETGAGITLIEAYEPGHSRSSSGDESRIIRCGYGPDEVYSRFALRSLQVWREWAASPPLRQMPAFFHPCGVLWLAGADPSYVEATRRTLEGGNHALEVLDRAALQIRFPQLRTDDVPLALLEPECGVVMARRAVSAAGAALRRHAVDIVHRRVAPTEQEAGPLRAVKFTDGGEMSGDAFVFACGAWLPRVFPTLLTGIIRPTRQVVMYFGTPAGDERFGPSRLPAWIDFEAGIYGIPDLEGRGVKLGIDRHGPPFDPDTTDRVMDPESLAAARAWLARRLPDMAEAPLVESRVCQYENTPNGDFLIDRHPAHENVWIVGGGSGHGFKHGPAVGEYVAGLVNGTVEPEPRFALAGKAQAAQRTVY